MRVRELASNAAVTVGPGHTLRDAAKLMHKHRVGSAVVQDGELLSGIITERDVLRALANRGGDAFAMPVGLLMSRPLATVPADAFVYRAIGRMNRLKIRHLGVTDEDGRVVGALSARDLLRLRAEQAVELGDEIDISRHASDLAAAWAKLPLVAVGLVAEGVSGRDIAAVVSRELGALTRQAAVVAEQRMEREGHGAPPCPYAVAVLGSAGRGESLLALDQDNALVFAEGGPGGLEDHWFEGLSAHIADILHEAGVPYCKGGVMAKSPQWRGSLATWRRRVADWIGSSSPDDLMSVDIFFDLRAVHGDGALANTLWREGFDRARGEIEFAKLLAEAAGTSEPALGLFGGFRTRNGRLDLKKAGLFGIVTLARVLAVCHHVVERTTPARLAGIKALGLGAERDLDALIEAQGCFLDLVLAQQIEDIENGLPATNTVVVKRLSQSDRNRLRAALRAVEHLDDLTRNLLFR
jgi:CBS domain-containing protein